MIDTLALQTAIVTVLSVQIADIPTFDEVPQDTAYPYIRIESLSANDAGCKDIDFFSYDVTLSVYSKATDEPGQISGKEPVYAIMKRMSAALQNQPAALVMDGSAAITLRLGFETCLQEQGVGQEDGTYYHGVQRYSTLVQETT